MIGPSGARNCHQMRSEPHLFKSCIQPWPSLPTSGLKFPVLSRAGIGEGEPAKHCFSQCFYMIGKTSTHGLYDYWLDVPDAPDHIKGPSGVRPGSTFYVIRPNGTKKSHEKVTNWTSWERPHLSATKAPYIFFFLGLQPCLLQQLLLDPCSPKCSITPQSP